jgi:hypothetical protein
MQTPIIFVAFNTPVDVTQPSVSFRSVRHIVYALCER